MHAAVERDDHKLLVAGFRSGNFSLARLNSNGTLDTSFGGHNGVAAGFVELYTDVAPNSSLGMFEAGAVQRQRHA